MIELIYNEEENSVTEEENLQEPKNIRQIGEPKDYKRIYIEDYVHNFLLRYSEENHANAKVAVLLGKSKKNGGKRQIYIKSALPVETVMERQGKYEFTEKIWGNIYQECEFFFSGQEILGWYLSKPGISAEKTDVTEETHRTYFSGADKVLFVVEPLEHESSFWGFDGNRFARQSGYYIYYEKNECMREYLTKKSEEQEMGRKHEKKDVAVANFRRILMEKQQNQVKKKRQVLTYGLRVSVIVLLCLCTVKIKDQADQMEWMEEQLSEKTESINVNVQETSGSDMIVEELPGEVEKILDQEQEASEEIPVTEAPEEEIQSLPQEETITENEELSTDSEDGSEGTETVQEAAAESVYEEYAVCAGDTLAGICRERYGSDEMIREICALNGITDGDYIQEGEIILLP